MYYEDLSVYRYHCGYDVNRVQNVGWLDDEHPFLTGEAPTGFLDALKQWFVHSQARMMRGSHQCQVCETAGCLRVVKYFTKHGHPCVSHPDMCTTIEGKEWRLGNGEIWVPTEAGVIYSVPTLIIHYVEAHSYLPPQPFIDAVMKPIPKGWDADTTAKSLVFEAYEYSALDPWEPEIPTPYSESQLRSARAIFEKSHGAMLTEEMEATIQKDWPHDFHSTDQVADLLWKSLEQEQPMWYRERVYLAFCILMRRSDSRRICDRFDKEIHYANFYLSRYQSKALDWHRHSLRDGFQAEKGRYDEALRRLELAIGEYNAHGTVTETCCDACRGLIVIRETDATRWKVDCSCGQFFGWLSEL